MIYRYEIFGFRRNPFTPMTTLLQTSRVGPPAPAAEQSLPLTFNDILWLPTHPIRRLLFYHLPSSKPHFIDTIVPKLKNSLTITLKHFFPLAGNILYSLTSNKLPLIRFIPGDSVCLTICESAHDFDALVGNHPRDADEFYHLVPQMPPPVDESGFKLQKLLALQLTLFPGRGVCIGVSNHHSAGDASSIAAFLRTWASINKLGGEEEFLISENESLPVFDRSIFKYPRELDSILWNQIKEFPFSSPSLPLPMKRVRATYVLKQSELGKLKNSIQSRYPNLGHVSSFVAMAGYTWWCFAKSGAADEEDKNEDDNRPDFFLFAMDIRSRLDPPVCGNYFGNCISYGLGKLGHGELVADGGVAAAAEAVAKGIRERLGKNIVEDAGNWVAEIGSLQSQKNSAPLAVSGSARVDLYGADFGWGKARKLEVVSIDGEEYAMSLSKARDSEGGLEIGMSLPGLRMEAFAAAFAHGITNL